MRSKMQKRKVGHSSWKARSWTQEEQVMMMPGENATRTSAVRRLRYLSICALNPYLKEGLNVQHTRPGVIRRSRRWCAHRNVIHEPAFKLVFEERLDLLCQKWSEWDGGRYLPSITRRFLGCTVIAINQSSEGHSSGLFRDFASGRHWIIHDGERNI